VLRPHNWTAGQIWGVWLIPGALVGLGVGFQDHEWGPDLFAGLVMATPPALVALLCRRWCTGKPNGQRAFYLLSWWSLSLAWFFGAGGFVMMGFLAKVFGNTGSDGVLGTAIKLGAGGGAMCGLVLGGPLGLLRMLMVANQPNSTVPEPALPDKA